MLLVVEIVDPGDSVMYGGDSGVKGMAPFEAV